MIGRNILMYFPWSRPDEEGAPLGILDNRFGTLFELRRLQWPKFEALADMERFNQGIAGFLDNILLQNYSLFREDMRVRTGNAVRMVERRTSESELRDLGIPVSNNFGLRPAKMRDGATYPHQFEGGSIQSLTRRQHFQSPPASAALRDAQR
jgi:hypothetical protein